MMNIKIHDAPLVFTLLCMFLPFPTMKASANDLSGELIDAKTFLEVTPQRCVALRKGQICYLEVNFSWQTNFPGNYCLFNTKVPLALYCWDDVDNGMFNLDFQSNENGHFVLRQKDNPRDLASTEVIVAWVYGNKKRQRSRWRLF